MKRCYLWTLRLPLSLCLRLLLFSFTTPTIVCAEAAFCIKAFFFLPSHLTVYGLLKAHRSILEKRKISFTRCDWKQTGRAVHLKAANHGNRCSAGKKKKKYNRGHDCKLFIRYFWFMRFETSVLITEWGKRVPLLCQAAPSVRGQIMSQEVPLGCGILE